ncbi:MAG: hypothetical protein Ta2A_02090 [Treponemataceae bacterium]|nr:MAG: hypothetical protein Ta2A_02090 [Treponemataceae bacterium]
MCCSILCHLSCLGEGITKPKSYFGIACEKLGIEVIAANTPQAKGRVERNHQVYQDRFVKGLRLGNISTMEDGNLFLEKTYLPETNAKFEKPPLESEDGHVPLFGVSLRDIFVFDHKRTVTNDFIVRFECRFLQIRKENKSKPRPRDKVVVRIYLDGALDILWQGKKLLVNELDIQHYKDHIHGAA